MIIGNEVQVRRMTMPVRRRFLASAAGLAVGAVVVPGEHCAQAAAPKALVAPKLDGKLGNNKLVGFMLAHEQFAAPDLTKIGAAAAQAGFSLLATSDNFQRWQANEAHVGEAWVTLGALGGKAEPAWIGRTVTCPTLRYHPTVVAEAFATAGDLQEPGGLDSFVIRWAGSTLGGGDAWSVGFF